VFYRPPVGGVQARTTLGHTGSAVLMLFAFLVIIVLLGRLFDFVLVGYRLPAIICSLSLIASLLLGGVEELRGRVGLPLLGLIVWMCLCVPLSYWPGGSVQHIMYASFFSFIWLPIAAGPRHMKDVRRIVYATAAACTTLLIVASDIDQAGDSNARLELSGGAFSNSEDVAFWAGFAMPLCLFAASRIKMPLLRIPLMVGIVIYFVRLVAFTGSRAGMLSLFAVACVMFYRSGALGRLAVFSTVVISTVIVVVTVPGHLVDRLSTLFGDDHAIEISEAALSARSRRELLKDGAMSTLRNPLFGVGPGMFAEQRWAEFKRKGQRKDFLVTHNAYLQISSESGFPGLFFYIAMLYGIYKTLRLMRARSQTSTDPEDQERLGLVRYLELSYVYILVCGMFLSIALYPAQFVIAGLALASERIAAQNPQPNPAAAQTRVPTPLNAPALPSNVGLNNRFPAR
jgi:O-antigen ligase